MLHGRDSLKGWLRSLAGWGAETGLDLYSGRGWDGRRADRERGGKARWCGLERLGAGEERIDVAWGGKLLGMRRDGREGWEYMWCSMMRNGYAFGEAMAE
jgi:hypothetical protein